MLHIRFSNRFEILLGALLERVRDEAGTSPFAAADILVPSAAVRRRIELAAADRFGICANLRFGFLAQWLWAQIGKLVAVPEASPFAPPLLAWRLYDMLAQPALAAAHPRLASYLSAADPAMRMELAERTAALFDQYLTYRPDWMACWLRGGKDADAASAGGRHPDRGWQQDLWRRLAADLGIRHHHPAEDFFERLDQLDDAALAAAGLPARLHVFCPPAIPPLYLQMLRRLGQRIEVELYVQNPCREYWFEIVDPRRLAYLASRQQDLYHEVGNRLLAAWGKQTQAFIDLLLDDDGQATVAHSVFDAPAGASLLEQVQAAVLDLRELEPGSVTLAEDDRSIEIHACHTLTRELEVLHDQLLARFAAPQPPQPGDILVVTPDLEQAAPLIDAVFGSAPPARRIPYTISGRPGSLVNPVARALLDLLALATSRHPASAVFALLQQPVVGARFGIGAGELDTVRGWLTDAGIRWGIDADHRTRYGLPKDGRHSFRDGLERLFLAYALPAATTEPFHGRIAAGQVEGSGAAALGGFYRLFTRLQALQRQLAQPLAPAAWRDTLLTLLDDVVAAPDAADDLRDTRRAIATLAANIDAGGVREPLPAELVQEALRKLLDEPTLAGRPGGSVTFTAISSLRALPYRMICVIGMADGTFPSSARAAEFDLMPALPRRGDRQRGHEDRNLFLDLLLAARERFYLSYTGRSVRDNAALPPSVLVADLLDYLAPAIAADPRAPASLRAARARLLVEHPLQPFSMRYFRADGGDARLLSFHQEYCGALQARLQAAAEPAVIATGDDKDDEAEPAAAQPPFFTAPLTAPEAEWRSVTMEQLLRFFRNPSAYLLRQRLGITLAGAAVELEDDEPLLPDYTSSRELAARLLPALLAGASNTELRALAHAGLEYPRGPLGELELEKELHLLGAFAERLRERTAPACLPPLYRHLDFDLEGENWQLQLALPDLRPQGLVRYRYGRAGAGDYLAGWLQHLFLNAAGCDGVAPVTHWLARDEEFHFEPVADAVGELRQLLLLYRHGLSRPLPFHSRSSWEYVEKNQSWSAAQAAWQGSMQGYPGEGQHPAYQLALRGHDALDAEFERIARLVFEPLRQALKPGGPA